MAVVMAVKGGSSVQIRSLRTVLANRVFKAYLLGHITHTGPRLLKILLLLYERRLNVKRALHRLQTIIETSLAFTNFPAFCATLFGSYTLLEAVFYQVARRMLLLVVQQKDFPDGRLLLRLCRILAGLTASSFSFRLLNSPTHGSPRTTAQAKDPNTYTDQRIRPQLAGKTLDFTLLITVRAVEAIIGDAWRRYRQNPSRGAFRISLESAISRLADPAVFMTSAGVVMWAWFYNPERLPIAYQKWISQAASVDERLVQALRNCRTGDFLYGKDTGQAPLLEGMCRDYNWPLIWGDPAKTVPVPCEMVHMGTSKSCHYHGASRFIRAFKFAFVMYLPIQLAVKMRNPSSKALIASIKEAIRSSAFLGAFIGLFYYSVCLSRTVIGPKLINKPQMWDSGLCVGAGCAACGLSIFVEKPQRRPELAFFVAPRAAAVFLPRRYDSKYLWREQTVFAMSAATLLAMIEENPKSARGLVAFVLSKILA